MNSTQIDKIASTVRSNCITVISDNKDEVEINLPDLRDLDASLRFKTLKKFISDSIDELGITVVNFREKKQ